MIGLCQENCRYNAGSIYKKPSEMLGFAKYQFFAPPKKSPGGRFFTSALPNILLPLFPSFQAVCSNLKIHSSEQEQSCQSLFHHRQ